MPVTQYFMWRSAALQRPGFRVQGLEAGGECRCRDERLAPAAEREVVRFPYAVLELKLSKGACPLWVTALIAAGDPPPNTPS